MTLQGCATPHTISTLPHHIQTINRGKRSAQSSCDKAHELDLHLTCSSPLAQTRSSPSKSILWCFGSCSITAVAVVAAVAPRDLVAPSVPALLPPCAGQGRGQGAAQAAGGHCEGFIYRCRWRAISSISIVPSVACGKPGQRRQGGRVGRVSKQPQGQHNTNSGISCLCLSWLQV